MASAFGVKCKNREMEPEKLKKQKPHVVCIPLPAQGHINPMMQVAKLLHSRGFFVSFVNTHFTHNRLLRSQDLDSLNSLEGFRFETISDGLPPSDGEAMQDLRAICESTREKCAVPFRDLMTKLNRASDEPRVTSIVSDGTMTFTLKIAEGLGIPEIVFWPAGACGFMAFVHFHELIRRGLVPLKDESSISNGHLDTTIDWIPGMPEIRLKDLPSFIRTTDLSEFFLNFLADEAQNTLKASAVIFNTYDDLEYDILQAIRLMVPHIYTIGPLSMMCRWLPDYLLKSAKSSMWKEDTECLKWLDRYANGSVIYVNFGSTTVVTAQQLLELAWGLANTNHPFLWVIRPDIISGDHASLTQDLMDEIEGRSMIASWCPQEEVLSHPSVGVFLTHSGWNSTLESISCGVPMICWPFIGEQLTNCHYACDEWGVGMEIGKNIKREEVEVLVKEFMGGEKGKEMKKEAAKWKTSAEIATTEGGSSYTNLELLIHQLIQPRDI